MRTHGANFNPPERNPRDRKTCFYVKMPPMRSRRKMPLRALEIFEAAARLGDASAAARELCISRSAVSQQLRLLEERVGVRLFERGARPARPTRAARELLAAGAGALDIVDDACLEVAKRESGRISVSAMPSDAAAWLIPRIADFHRKAPGVRLAVHNAVALADFRGGGADAALRYGAGDYPGLFAEKLGDEFIAPLCSPEYLAKNPVGAPEDLCRRDLICDLVDAGEGYERHAWRGWLASLGIGDEPQNIVMSTNLTHQVLRLAKAGEGVALGRGLLSVDDLRRGELAPALPFSIPTGFAHYFVCPFSARRDETVRRFADWLRDEFENHRRAMREFFPPPRKIAGRNVNGRRAGRNSSRAPD